MLGKLLKYEMKATARPIVPAFLAVLGLTLISSLFILFGNPFENVEGLDTVYTTVFGSLLAFTIIAIVVFTAVVIIFILQRFYKNFFTDEAYLTFTLPVSTSQNLGAKLISGFLWILLAGFVSLFCIFYIIFVAALKSAEGLSLAAFFDALGRDFQTAFARIGLDGAVFGFELLVMVLVSMASSLIIYYLSVTLGCFVAKKHKVWGSIGMYFAINFAISIISNLLYSFLTVGVYAVDYSIASVFHVMLLVPTLLYLCIGVAGWFLCVKLLRDKINLQ